MITQLMRHFGDFLWSELRYIIGQLRDKWLVISVPYAWLAVFFLFPFLIIVKISFSELQVSMPPFRNIIEWTPDLLLKIRLHFESYWTVLTDNFYLHTVFSSLRISLFSTAGCLIIGYMIAYSISRVKISWRMALLLMIALPFWTSFLIRVYAWMAMLSSKGLVNSILLKLHIIGSPLQLLDNDAAVCLGIIYCYLPFMVFPIYASLIKINKDFIEAAHDLGCTPWRAFWSITVPLSKQGMIAGIILVFLPAIGEFVIPEILGGPETVTIGRVLWWEFFNNRNWPLASAVAVLMILLFVVPIMMLKNRQLEATEKAAQA
ncbi:MAG: ABC transporter permease subunit [Pseudomonadota bacterium]|jgi:putrescine transport system permease protein|nr:ABC transporter permease subunit [Alphaproteobacteria bacterium]